MNVPAWSLLRECAVQQKNWTAAELVPCLLDPNRRESRLRPCVVIFSATLNPKLQIAFAKMHGITKAQLSLRQRPLRRILANPTRSHREWTS